MIGAAMTSVLHGQSSQLDDLIDDWKALFPLVLASARARGQAGAQGAPGELTDRKKLKGKR